MLQRSTVRVQSSRRSFSFFSPPGQFEADVRIRRSIGFYINEYQRLVFETLQWEEIILFFIPHKAPSTTV